MSAGAYDLSVRSAGLRRRRIVEKLFAGIAVLSAAAAVAVLVIVIGSVVSKGASSLSLDFFTEPRGLFGAPGGIADAIVGSLLIVAMATVFAVPFGVLVAIYLTEFGTKAISTALRIVLDVLNGIPAIVVGIFVFGVVVVGPRPERCRRRVRARDPDGPDVARATQEVLRSSRARCGRRASRSASAAGGRSSVSCSRPTLGGIVTGIALAVARVAGETAPLLFTSSITATAISTDVSPGARVDPAGDDLQLLRVSRPGRAGARRGPRRSS